MDTSEIVGYGLGQIGMWIVAGLVGSLIVIWMMGFFDHGPRKGPEDLEYEKEQEKKYRKENPKESIWPLAIGMAIVLWLLFSSSQVSASYLNGYELLPGLNNKEFSNHSRQCNRVKEDVVYIKIDQETYPADKSFTLLDGPAEISDLSVEKICISHAKNKIYLLTDTFWSDSKPECYLGSGRSRNNGYTACNSNFYQFDGGGTSGITFLSCLLLACIPSMGGLHNVEFNSNSFYDAVKHLNLTNFKNFRKALRQLQVDFDGALEDFLWIQGASYNYYSYDLDDFNRSLKSQNLKLTNMDTSLSQIEETSSQFVESFIEYQDDFTALTDRINNFKLRILELDEKKLRFAANQKTGKADAQKKIQAREKEAKKLAQIKQDKKDAEHARVILTLATKKILFNLGYEIDEINSVFDLKAQTALLAFQKDYDLSPVVSQPNQNILVELQSAFRNSPNPIDLTKYKLLSSGSGFLVHESGFVVTNAHVVDGCSLLTVGKGSPANIEKADKTNDVAILKINNIGNYSPLQISKADIELGEEIFVAGFPLNAMLENLNFTSGTISSEVGYGQNISEFQFTAPIQPGNSGGPIFNAYGGVVGMAVSSASTKELEAIIDSNIQNINFGIKASTFKSLLKQADIELEMGNPNWFSSQKNVAMVAKTGTVLIQCWED